MNTPASEQLSPSQGSVPLVSESSPARTLTIEDFVVRANELCKEDYGAFIAYCNQNSFSLPAAHEKDPFAAAYRQHVLQHYLRVTGVSEYQPSAHELANFADTKAPLHRQFPYLTRDPQTIGQYLMGVGHMVANIGVPSGSYVVEYGAGWGHISLALGQSGYDVVCVDIDPSFVELINMRARAEQASVQAYQGEFGFRPDGERAVDAVVFFEAFHHSLEHVALTRQLQGMLRPGGRLLLGGEPIYPWFPNPWGLRLDGHAAWAISNFRWMELGFHDDYILRLLLRHGFSVQKRHQPDIGPLGLLYIGTKIDGELQPGQTLLPADEAATWNASDEYLLKFATERSMISVADLVGHSEIILSLRNYLSLPLGVSVALGDAAHTKIVPPGDTVSVVLPMHGNTGPLIVMSDTHCPQELGLNDDSRHLGIALLSLTYR